MEPSEPLGPGTRPGYPLRGLSWGLLAAVVAALALFAAVLVAENGGASGSGTPAAAPPTPSARPAPQTSPGAIPASATRSGAAAPAPPAPSGTVLSQGELSSGWESDGWSWDSTVRSGSAGPDGTAAVAVTYLKPYGGYALRSDVTTKPAATSVLRVRIQVTGKPVRVGLQVQSSDDGELGTIVPVDVRPGGWTTVSAALSVLKPPAGVRRISIIAQNVPAGTMVWVSDVSLR